MIIRNIHETYFNRPSVLCIELYICLLFLASSHRFFSSSSKNNEIMALPRHKRQSSCLELQNSNALVWNCFTSETCEYRALTLNGQYGCETDTSLSDRNSYDLTKILIAAIFICHWTSKRRKRKRTLQTNTESESPFTALETLHYY